MHSLHGLLDTQIGIQKDAIYGYRMASGALFLLGIAFIAFALSVPSAFAADIIKAAAGLFGIAFSALPYKEIPPRRERIATYTHLKTALLSFDSLSAEEQQSLLDLVKRAIDETLRR